MTTLFIALGSLSHYSDILRSRLLDDLAHTHRIIVLTDRIGNDEAAVWHLPLHPNVSYEKIYPARASLLSFSDQYLRHPFVREFDSWHITRHWYYRPTHRFSVRAATAIGSIIPASFPAVPFITALEKILIRPSKQFRELIQREKPKILITATPGFTPFEAEMIISARRMKIETAAIDINYDNFYSKAKFCRRTDSVVVWNEKMKKEAVEFGYFKPEDVFVGGCLRFDHYFQDDSGHSLKSSEEFLRSKNLDPAKKTIVFAGPSPIMYPPRKAFAEALIGLKQKGVLEGDPNILFRLHPHDVGEPYEEFARIKNVCIERAGAQRIDDTKTKGTKVEMEEEDLKNLKETLMRADIVINFVSTMIIEASIFDKPIISIGFPEWAKAINNYEVNKALIDTGCLKVAPSPEALGAHINRYLAHPEYERAERKKVVSDYAMFTDGCSWKRIANFIKKIVIVPKYEPKN